eukprot:120123-Alexandrium_andersonii.AAC.1
MSASLVGSEMCIRDRLPLEHRAHELPRVHGALDGRRAVGQRWPSAVSYTHRTLPTICSV